MKYRLTSEDYSDERIARARAFISTSSAKAILENVEAWCKIQEERFMCRLKKNSILIRPRWRNFINGALIKIKSHCWRR